jgi:signal transduction histidine kinase
MALLAVFMAFTPAPVGAAISEIALVLGLLFAAACSFGASRRAEPGRERWAWRCMALAEVGYACAEVIVPWLPATRHTLPRLGGTATFFLPFSVLGAGAAILFPAIETTGVRLARVALDACIVAGALFGPALVVLIAPRITSGAQVDYGAMALPVVDVAALFTLVALLARGVQQTYRFAFFWLVGGFFCFACADALFSYLTLPGIHAYSPGLPIVDLFWIAGACAFGLAPLALLTRSEAADSEWGWLEQFTRPADTLRRPRMLGQFFLLASPVVALFGLLALTEGTAPASVTRLLELLIFLVALLIILRQTLTMRDLLDAQAATARAQQLEALKDQFITSINHELRTPMMTMQGYIELLDDLQEQVQFEKRREMLERARRASASLVQLLQSILDVRRIDQEASDFVPQAVNVSAAVQAALTLVDPHQEHFSERALIVRIPEELTIWGEAIRLQQILTNLLSNALKYSPPGTTIQVQARTIAERGPILPGWGRNPSLGRSPVEITVQDEGLGIPPEQNALLFRRFVRLPRDMASRIRGTGLGLYLCRVFAEAMGGAIWVESSGVPGEGSTFYLRLPTPAGDAGAVLPGFPPEASRERQEEAIAGRLSRGPGKVAANQ